MPHTYYFRKFLGQPLPPELRRLFSNLELWRQRGGARPLIVLEQGDHNVRFYLEQYLRYRHTISNFGSLVVDGDPSPRPFLIHPRHKRVRPTVPPDHFRGQTYPMIMMLDTQETYPTPTPCRAEPTASPASSRHSHRPPRRWASSSSTCASIRASPSSASEAPT